MTSAYNVVGGGWLDTYSTGSTHALSLSLSALFDLTAVTSCEQYKFFLISGKRVGHSVPIIILKQ